MVINLPSIYRLYDKTTLQAKRKNIKPLSFKDFVFFILGTDNLSKGGYVHDKSCIILVDEKEGYHKYNIKWSDPK